MIISIRVASGNAQSFDLHVLLLIYYFLLILSNESFTR